MPYFMFTNNLTKDYLKQYFKSKILQILQNLSLFIISNKIEDYQGFYENYYSNYNFGILTRERRKLIILIIVYIGKTACDKTEIIKIFGDFQPPRQEWLRKVRLVI